MYGQYDSSDGSMDAMGLNVDKKCIRNQALSFMRRTKKKLMPE